MRNVTRENLFERWLEEVVRAAGPYNSYETFARFSERINTVSDTVTGDAEVSPASEKRDGLSNDSEGSTNPGNADPRTQVHHGSENTESTQGKDVRQREHMGSRSAQRARDGTG